MPFLGLEETEHKVYEVKEPVDEETCTQTVALALSVRLHACESHRESSFLHEDKNEEKSDYHGFISAAET